jgi:hypothetical protein
MRTVAVVSGFVVFALGVAWALQGASILPATYMQGPAWIYTGGFVALVGIGIVFYGLRRKRWTS